MRIQVGIHENVIIEKVTINDKGRLVVTLKQKGESETTVGDDPFAQMNASEVIEKESGSGIIFWPFKAPEAKNKEGVELSDQQRGESANGDVMQLKNQLQQILEQYTTKDNIKWSIFDGTGMTKETYYQDLASQTTLDVIYRNLCEQFISTITPFLNDEKFAVRFKLARQSKDKHYARVPGMFIKDNPFIESMDVPKEQSRVKWTDYELKQGLNDGTPVSRSTADTEEEPAEGENVFGGR
jgi:hypothetical protein